MKERVHLSRWKSPAAEARFRRLEDDLVEELATERPEALDVPTRLGQTRAYRWPGDGEPVVFLHGATGTSLMWARYAECRGGRLAYAIDTIGDVGRSRQQVPVEGPGDLAGWLAETLEQLGVGRAHVVGTSYGGFLGLNLAVHHPEMVRSLFLVEPAGIERVRMARFMAWGLSTLLASLLPGPLRRRAARRLRVPALEDARIFRFVFYGQRHHRARLLRPGPLTDDELRAIDAPTSILLGAKSEVFPTRAVAARAQAMPNVTVEPIDGAGHALVTSHQDVVTDRLDGFLRRQERTSDDQAEQPGDGRDRRRRQEDEDEDDGRGITSARTTAPPSTSRTP